MDDRNADRGQYAIGSLMAPGKPSLGDKKLVWGLLTGIVHKAWLDPNALAPEVKRVSGILVGDDQEHYATMGSWNGGNDDGGIGAWIRGHMKGVPASGGDRLAVEYALSHLALHALDAIKRAQNGDETHEVGAARVRVFVERWTHVMLGIPVIHKDEELGAADNIGEPEDAPDDEPDEPDEPEEDEDDEPKINRDGSPR